MVLVSASRLQVRRGRFILPFLWQTLRIGRELRRAPGFLKGVVVHEDLRRMWTCTLWEDKAAMDRFRGSGLHLEAMRRHLDAFDELVHGHWEQDDEALPPWDRLYEGLARHARFRHLSHPSSVQAEGAVPYYPSERALHERTILARRR
jgi:heme-degrading monooxygenase HmoA